MSVYIALTDDIAACLAVRRVVFIEEQGVSEEDELDGLDADCLHVLAVAQDTPVGTARVIVAEDTAKIGRVCVLKPHRGTGLGQEIIRKCIEIAEMHDAKPKLGAQVHALGFYEALGFVAFGPIYDDAGIPHRDMVYHG